MLNSLLGLMFPPKPSKLGPVPAGSLALHRVRAGELKAEDPDPMESWAGNLTEWGNGRWNKPTRIFGELKTV